MAFLIGTTWARKLQGESGRKHLENFSQLHRSRCQTTFHCWRSAFQSDVRAAEIIPTEEYVLCRCVMLDRLAEPVCQPGEPSHLHSKREVQTLNVACADSILVRVADNHVLVDGYYRGRTVPNLFR